MQRFLNAAEPELKAMTKAAEVQVLTENLRMDKEIERLSEMIVQLRREEVTHAVTPRKPGWNKNRKLELLLRHNRPLPLSPIPHRLVKSWNW